VDFSEARDLFVIIFQILGSDCKFMDCELISKKQRGLSAKCPKLDFLGIVFLKENPWTESTSLWSMGTPVHGGSAVDGGTELAGASASGRSGVHGRRPRGVGSAVAAHQGASGSVAAGRRGGAVAVGKIRW
jgi:hypothetical protein